MDAQTQVEDTKPISDDQELAKALAGVSPTEDLNYEETPPAVAPAAVDATQTPAVDTPAADPDPPVVAPAAVEPVADATTPPYMAPDPTSTVAGDEDLETIKKDALVELRPLVDKLELAPEEQFDTYLLLLRSTDDKSLIAPAHKAAQNIADETRRAQALLDIIKEIDYFSQGTQQPTV